MSGGTGWACDRPTPSSSRGPAGGPAPRPPPTHAGGRARPRARRSLWGCPEERTEGAARPPPLPPGAATRVGGPRDLPLPRASASRAATGPTAAETADAASPPRAGAAGPEAAPDPEDHRVRGRAERPEAGAAPSPLPAGPRCSGNGCGRGRSFHGDRRWRREVRFWRCVSLVLWPPLSLCPPLELS